MAMQVKSRGPIAADQVLGEELVEGEGDGADEHQTAAEEGVVTADRRVLAEDHGEPGIGDGDRDQRAAG